MLYPEEDQISLETTKKVAGILAAFDSMTASQLEILTQGGRLLDDFGPDLWKATRPYPAVDDLFGHLVNKTREIALRHNRRGAIEGDQVFLCSLAIQAAAVSLLLADRNPAATTDLLAAGYQRALRA